MSWIKDISQLVFLVMALVLIAMDPPLIVLGAIAIIISGIMVYRNGWENTLIKWCYILTCIAILVSTEHFFGQTGKEYLAIFLWTAICAVLYIRKKKGLKIWW